MNFDAKICTLLAILCIVIFEDHSVLGDCGTNVKSPHVACLYPEANGKCPQGMLRVDSDEKVYYDDKSEVRGKRVCPSYYGRLFIYNSKNEETRTKIELICCLLTSYSRVDIKIKDSPCTGGACKKY